MILTMEQMIRVGDVVPWTVEEIQFFQNALQVSRLAGDSAEVVRLQGIESRPPTS